MVGNWLWEVAGGHVVWRQLVEKSIKKLIKKNKKHTLGPNNASKHIVWAHDMVKVGGG